MRAAVCTDGEFHVVERPDPVPSEGSEGQSQNSGPHEEPPAFHVGRPYPSHPFPLHLTRTVGDSSSDVLPERVRPKGEPAEESDSEPTRKARRKGPRHRGR